jgi:hypothetical protein
MQVIGRQVGLIEMVSTVAAQELNLLLNLGDITCTFLTLPLGLQMLHVSEAEGLGRCYWHDSMPPVSSSRVFRITISVAGILMYTLARLTDLCNHLAASTVPWVS